MNRLAFRFLAPAALAPFAACLHLGADHEPATAQRPTVSSDVNTVAEGTFELDAGLVIDPDDALDTPLEAKYGLGPRTEGYVGFSPWVYVDPPGADDGGGLGDLYLGVRHRFREEAGGVPALAWQVQAKLPTGDDDEGVSSGATDLFAAAIATGTRGELAWTGFYQLGVLGELEASSGALQHDLALALVLPHAGAWSGFGEVAGIFLPEEEVEYGLVTLGATFSRVPWRVFDVGVAFGVGEDRPDAQLLLGITENLGHPRRSRGGP